MTAKQVIVYEGRDGKLFRRAEDAEASLGAKRCECGAELPNYRSKCVLCCYADQVKRHYERLQNMQVVEWDNATPIYHDGSDSFFTCYEDVQEWMHENGMEEIDCQLCEPNFWRPIDPDYWEDVMPEEMDDLPGELTQKLEEFNQFLTTLRPPSWYPGYKHRVVVKRDDENIS